MSVVCLKKEAIPKHFIFLSNCPSIKTNFQFLKEENLLILPVCLFVSVWCNEAEFDSIITVGEYDDRHHPIMCNLIEKA
jgi:hypothetical protein